MEYDIRDMKRNRKGRRLRTIIEDNERPTQCNANCMTLTLYRCRLLIYSA